MNDIAIHAAAATSGSAGAARKPDESARIAEAATQFEALLIGQLLRSAREGVGGWAGDDRGSADECATDMGDQQLAALLAGQGGLGLASLISAGLRKGASPAAAEPVPGPGAKSRP